MSYKMYNKNNKNNILQRRFLRTFVFILRKQKKCIKLKSLMLEKIYIYYTYIHWQNNWNMSAEDEKKSFENPFS